MRSLEFLGRLKNLDEWDRACLIFNLVSETRAGTLTEDRKFLLSIAKHHFSQDVEAVLELINKGTPTGGFLVTHEAVRFFGGGQATPSKTAKGGQDSLTPNTTRYYGGVQALSISEISVRSESGPSQTALGVFDSLSLVVPGRIAAEDVGDAIEIINHLVKTGRPPWQIYLKTASCVFWVSLNAFREVMSSILGKAKVRTKQG